MKKRKIELWRSTEFIEFVVEEKRVVGAVVKKDGNLIRIKTSRGVMIASGGFGQNQDMREEYLPKPTNKDWGCEPSTNTGEPIKAAEAIGAKLKFMDKAWWVTTVKAPDEDFPRLSEVEKSLPGNYKINVYQIKDNKILNMKEKTITLAKSGIGSKIYDFAHKNSAAYGLFTIIFAILSGFLAATMFRRL